MKQLQSHSKLIEIQTRLSKQSYLSRANLPGSADGKMIMFLQSIKRYPDRKSYPNFYHWYILMKQFAVSSIQKWIQKNQHQDDSLIVQFINLKISQNDSSTKQVPTKEGLTKQGSSKQVSSKQVSTKQVSPSLKELSSPTTFKKQKSSSQQMTKLIKSEEYTTIGNNQIEYIMDVRIKEGSQDHLTDVVLVQFFKKQEVELQELQIFAEERRFRILTKMDANKYEDMKNRISHLQGVQTFQSKKKEKKFKTANSLTNYTGEA